jgi:hypothetical protein
MAKELFIDWNPNQQSRQRLVTIGKIIEEYHDDGITLTLRQLYYRLVAAGVVPNSQREYKRLGTLLSNARLAGFVDWDAIEDRVRRAVEWQSFDTIQECASYAARTFNLPRWNTQPTYVELWCEKDALSSVLQPICSELFATLMVNRGYSSSSAMYDARTRIDRERDGREVEIIYLGDFDPSGEDMVRDIRDRLAMLQVEDVNVTKLALNPDQVSKWKLPPNPAKMSDSRAGGFVAKHGKQSYEVDAIPPKELQKMVRAAITSHMDMAEYNAVKERELILRAKLVKAAEKIK